ncbi:hypothetical protein TSAR_003542 [Trichomalopsis sarcophagae]|uniref:Uncharacterized protein n=1 Tax=Trichomalopsis sarcophagae TaxID=543379 RepID=A0A232FEK7_9HYME|nr:hypothetical protein TSAR_003542 [Trichomalopsis sarcophagae]
MTLTIELKDKKRSYLNVKLSYLFISGAKSSVTCVHTSPVSNYYKKASRECNAVAAVARRQSVCLASQRISVQARGPSLFRCTLHSSYPKASESTEWNTRNGLSSVRRRVEECNAVADVERRQSVCLASQRISVQARGPSLFCCTLHS